MSSSEYFFTLATIKSTVSRPNGWLGFTSQGRERLGHAAQLLTNVVFGIAGVGGHVFRRRGLPLDQVEPPVVQVVELLLVARTAKH